MSRSSFAKLTVTRLRFPMRDDFGAQVPDYDEEPDELEISGCWYEPTTSTEVRDGRTAVFTGYTIDAPAGADVIAVDRVRVAGSDFDVEGEPLSVPSPTGTLASKRIVVGAWEG
ncbi:hypothetical protein [Microbacterium sp. A1-JK]|uniref:hypothetical protein n=1 Tax=Microbacterium sp. A1-JK TaxID=3177516 RepID=UPI00388AC5E7